MRSRVVMLGVVVFSYYRGRRACCRSVPSPRPTAYSGGQRLRHHVGFARVPLVQHRGRPLAVRRISICFLRRRGRTAARPRHRDDRNSAPATG